MRSCAWCTDGVCVNSDCPLCADLCPVEDTEGVCAHEKRDGEIEAEKMTGRKIAPWVEDTAKALVMTEPSSAAMVAIYSDGRAMTAYYEASVTEKYAICSRIQSDIIIDIVKINFGGEK